MAHRVKFKVASSSNLIRIETYDGRDHIVVPVVAMIGEAVIWSMNANAPELVPSDALSVAPAGWNGRPVVFDHPDGGYGSANEPRTLESMAFGIVFNSRFDDGRLKMEAWLDPMKAEKVGPDAVAVIDSVKAGEIVEISVGAYIVSTAAVGKGANGLSYNSAWSEIIPDHLAMGLSGKEGACSVEDGCGGPRINSRNEEVKVNAKKGIKSFFDWFAANVTIRSNAGEDGDSDNDMRNKLWDALRSVEGFDCVVEFFPEASVVVYTTRAGDNYLWYKRSFGVGKDGKVTLAEDGEQVEPVTVYQPVAEMKSSASPSNDASEKKSEGHEAPSEQKGASSMSNCKIKSLVARVVASGKFTEEQITSLSLNEAQLTALADGLEAKSETPPPAEAVAKPAEVTPKPAELTEEQQIEALPASVKAMVSRYQQREHAERKALIASLAARQDEFSAEDLEKEPTSRLESLARMLEVDVEQVVDFSGRIGATIASNADDSKIPDPWRVEERLKKVG